MTPLRTLPSAREQARHALLLLAVPVPPRIVVQVHRALFDGDLSVPAVASLLRVERQSGAPVVCCGLSSDLSGLFVALAEWPVERRVVAPGGLAAGFVRVAEFVRMQGGASRAAFELLRSLAEEVGPDRFVDLASLSEWLPSASASGPADAEFRRVVAERAVATLDQRELLFGRPAVPHQRGRA
jgi:hypothetical protein